MIAPSVDEARQRYERPAARGLLFFRPHGCPGGRRKSTVKAAGEVLSVLRKPEAMAAAHLGSEKQVLSLRLIGVRSLLVDLERPACLGRLGLAIGIEPVLHGLLIDEVRLEHLLRLAHRGAGPEIADDDL